jgi:hypothetical protein
MFFIPGILISILTFPGVMIHEWAHKVFCERLGVKVHKVVYFQLKNPAGYVLHELPQTYKQTFWISVGPLIVNTIAAVVLSFLATQANSGGVLWAVFIWLAVSAGMHAFPSDHDMQHIALKSKESIKSGGSVLHYLAFPFVALVWIANKLRFFWFDAIYALALVALGGGLNAFADTSTPSPTNSAITASPSTTDTSDNSSSSSTVRVGHYMCPIVIADEADAANPSDSESSSIDAEKTSLDTLSSEIDNDQVDNSDQSDIDRHNAMVDEYNSRLASYHSRVSTYNAEVDKYNNILSTGCAPI